MHLTLSPPVSTRLPSTTLFRSRDRHRQGGRIRLLADRADDALLAAHAVEVVGALPGSGVPQRVEAIQLLLARFDVALDLAGAAADRDAALDHQVHEIGRAHV